MPQYEIERNDALQIACERIKNHPQYNGILEKRKLSQRIYKEKKKRAKERIDHFADEASQVQLQDNEELKADDMFG